MAISTPIAPPMGGNLENTRARLRIGRRRSDSKSRRNRRNLGSDCAALRLWPHFRSLKATTPTAQRSLIAAVAEMQAAAGAGRATRARARPGKADEVEGREQRKKEKGEAGERVSGQTTRSERASGDGDREANAGQPKRSSFLPTTHFRKEMETNEYDAMRGSRSLAQSGNTGK